MSSLNLCRLPPSETSEQGRPEIFRTLQGEGVSSGCPAVFLRLSQCNLHCHWCDTPFTWNWENTPWKHEGNQKFKPTEHQIRLSLTELAEILKEKAKSGDHLVVTGGEPLLQQQQLAELFPLLSNTFSMIEIETNGTQIPSKEVCRYVDQFNVSPKLSNSGMKASLRLKTEALLSLTSQGNTFFKFVIAHPNDMKEVQELVQQLSLQPKRVLLMPEGRSREELSKNRLWIAQECLANGYRFTDRLHVELWGDKRGR